MRASLLFDAPDVHALSLHFATKHLPNGLSPNTFDVQRSDDICGLRQSFRIPILLWSSRQLAEHRTVARRATGLQLCQVMTQHLAIEAAFSMRFQHP